METEQRNATVERLIPVAKRVVGTFMRSGERASIERSELEAQAYLAVLRAVKDFKPEWGIAIEERVAREVKNALVRHIKREYRHWQGRVRIEDLLSPPDDD